MCSHNDIAHLVTSAQEDQSMRYEDLGPVANPDGSPTDMTRAMLAGTGRDPEAFARGAVIVDTDSPAVPEGEHLAATKAFLKGEPIGSPARPAMVGGLPFVVSDDVAEQRANAKRLPPTYKAPVTSRVIDETLLRGDYSPSGGTSFERWETETLVTGTGDPEEAKREADWRVRQTIEGTIGSVTFERIEGPDWQGSYIVTSVVETTREW